MSDDEERRSEAEEEYEEEEAIEEPEEDEDEQSRERQRREEEERKQQVAAERQRKQEEKAKKEAAEASKKQRKPGQKRKGLGGLSPEKKRLLKQLIMQKAADEMKAEMKKRQEEKENYLKGKIQPLDIDGQLESKVKQLYDKLKSLESDRYDWEEKLRRQDFEINELTIKVNDVKGKFVKPVLKKVSKTDITLAKLDKKHSSNLSSMKTQLKSTGQNKFALDENPKEDKADWRAELKSKEEEAAEA